MIKYSDGATRHYNEKDQLHREDGPAVIWDQSGDKEWFINGVRHRIDGPAVDYSTIRVWFVNGDKHREDGAAIEHIGADEKYNEYYLRGKRVRANSLIEFLDIVRFKAFL